MSIHFLSRIIIFNYLNIIRRWRLYILVLILFQLYIIDIIEYFSDRIPINQLRLHLLTELTSKIDNIIYPTEYRFYTMTAGYCPHPSHRDDSKLCQKQRELFFIALIIRPKYNNTLRKLDSCRVGIQLFISGYY